MTVLFRAVDLCWEGLTLKHITEKKLIVSYILFMILAFIFELYLLFLLIITACLESVIHIHSGLLLFVCLGIVFLCLIMNGMILFAVVPLIKVKEKSSENNEF